MLFTVLWYMREEVTGSVCSVKVLFSDLCLGIPNGLFPSGFQTKALYKIVSLYMPHTTCPTTLVHDLITPIIFAIPIMKLCSLLQSHVTSFPLGSDIFLSTMFPETFSSCCLFNVSDQVSHPCTSQEKVIVSHILFFLFLDRKWEDK